MATGFLNGNVPYVQVSISRRKVVSPFFVLDTGFNGTLQINPQVASDIGLHVNGAILVNLADGSLFEIPYGFGSASLDGIEQKVQILVSNGPSLLGINFLKIFRYTIILDCHKETLELRNA